MRRKAIRDAERFFVFGVSMPRPWLAARKLQSRVGLSTSSARSLLSRVREETRNNQRYGRGSNAWCSTFHFDNLGTTQNE